MDWRNCTNLDKPLNHGSDINLRIPALITDDYVHDVHTRLITYKRIANAKSDEELHQLQVELADRFGSLPDSTQNVFRLTAIKLCAQRLGLSNVDSGPKGGRTSLDEEFRQTLASLKLSCDYSILVTYSWIQPG